MKSLRVPATLDSLGAIADYVMAAAAAAGLGKQASYGLRLAVDEIATNIIVHGYTRAGLRGGLELRAAIDDQTLTLWLEDTGLTYDPRQAPAPATHLPLELRPIGGLGTYLALKSVDQFVYERVEERNRSIFKMHLPSAPAAESGGA